MKKWVWWAILIVSLILLGFVIFKYFSTEKKIFCGGIAAIPCPEGYFCKLEGTYPDAGGNCIKEQNVVCTLDYNPVCGIDGQTYGNKCMAKNVKIAYLGECGNMENAFSSDRICTKEYNPQCGADGITYGNPCMAGEMTLVHEGEC